MSKPKLKSRMTQTILKLSNMLRQELKGLAEVEEIRGREPSDVLLCIRFRDGHIHTVYPDQDVTAEMYENISIDYGFDNDLLMPDEPVREEEKVIKLAARPQSINATPAKDQLPKRIILHNRQAIGDILMFTCAVRDFKKAYPQVEVKVESTAMHIWDNNPFINRETWPDPVMPEEFQTGKGKLEGMELKRCMAMAVQKAITEDSPVKLYVGPGRATNASNRSDRHFANAFRISIEEILGIGIPQGPIRPDIYMTPQEFDASPLIEPPYWLITAGEKGDWTAKTYRFTRWQKVIEMCPDFKFVQIGAKGHKHPVLSGPNVINYIGKTEDRHTGIRNLFNLFLNCEGSVGLVSFQMHLAAAFNKPCVVIAGAREPVWFTRYPGQQYLATDGCLPCTVNNNDEPKACWICDINRCPYVQEEDGQKVPLCADLITPESVADAIRRYYYGGRLSHEEPAGRSKLVNINGPTPDVPVRETKMIAPTEVKPEDALLKKWGFTWGNTSITERDWSFIKKVIEDYDIKSVIETGCGLSTLLFKHIGLTVESYDGLESWINRVKGIDSALNIIPWDGVEPLGIKSGQFDMGFIDGPCGGNNREVGFSSMVNKVPVIIVHDAGRPPEREWQAKYLEPAGYKLIAKGGHRCHFWAKDRKPKPVVLAQGDRVVKMFFNGRGEGGAEASTTHIMNGLMNLGHKVQYYSPSGSPSGTFRAAGNKEIPVLNAFFSDSVKDPCDLAVLYVNDWVWEFAKKPVERVMSGLQAERKVMVVNFRLGSIGNIEWTRNWDQYLFLNRGLERAFKERCPNANTMAMAPPVDLTAFMQRRLVNLHGPMRIVRHSSQGDSKYPKNFNEIIGKILEEIPEVEVHLMPAPTFLEDFGSRVKAYKRNQPPVWEFLAKGNLFWYILPEGYHDQGPKVIMEAQAMGLPVIADNHSGAADRIVSGTGFLCDNVRGHIEALKIMRDPEMRTVYGRKAYDHAGANYGISQWLEKIIGEKGGQHA